MKQIIHIFKSYRKLHTNAFRLLLLVVIGTICYYILTIKSLTFYHSYDTVEWQEADIIYSTKSKFDIPKKSLNKSEIVILRYTKYFGRDASTLVLNEANDCSYFKEVLSNNSNIFKIPCRITFDKTYFNASDVLIFHSHDLKSEPLPMGHRDPNKLWVYLQQESPHKTDLNLKAYPNVFNWTMTYRRDSDVYHPYAYIVPDLNKTTQFVINRNKTGLVAWIVSNCDPPSKRQYFVYELQKYISVDIFGYCGNECPAKDCYSYVASNYKFYLAFENSLCHDYITEKFFESLMHDLIPVVYGGNQAIDYASIAPEHSYIDARSFNSPKDLAEYLLYLDRTEEYIKYFDWKTKYKVVIPRGRYWCHLCQRVYEHLMENPAETKWYKDLWKWWYFMGTPLSDGRARMTTPTCAKPLEKFTNFYHGIWKTGIGGKFSTWARKNIFKL